MATESHGASLMVGLLEIPNPSVWPPHSDEAYWNWVKENQRQADKKGDSRLGSRRSSAVLVDLSRLHAGTGLVQVYAVPVRICGSRTARF